MTQTIYISGPMTGLPENNFPAFHTAAERLKGLGYQVINPADIVPEVMTWEACMRADIKALMGADIVAVLPGWQDSKGTRIEVDLSQRLGMMIVCANTLNPIEDVG
jgi:hypothetical protein